MKQYYDTPLTNKNLRPFWDMVCDENKRARRNKAASGTAVIAGSNLLSIFAIAAMFFALSMAAKEEKFYLLQKLPFFPGFTDACGRFADIFSKDNIIIRTLVSGAAAFAGALAVTVLITLCVKLVHYLVFRGETEQLPMGDGEDLSNGILNKIYDTEKIYAQARDKRMPKIVLSIAVALLLPAVYIFSLLTYGVTLDTMAENNGILKLVIATIVLWSLVFGAFILFGLITGTLYKRKLDDIEKMRLDCEAFSRATEEYQKKLEKEAEERRQALENKKMGEEEVEKTAELRDAVEMEKKGDYAGAKAVFLELAQSGRADGMIHYARHQLIEGNTESAKEWLEKAVATGKTDTFTIGILEALKQKKTVRAKYWT